MTKPVPAYVQQLRNEADMAERAAWRQLDELKQEIEDVTKQYDQAFAAKKMLDLIVAAYDERDRADEKVDPYLCGPADMNDVVSAGLAEEEDASDIEVVEVRPSPEAAIPESIALCIAIEPKTTAQISEELGISKNAVSIHLSRMKAQGLVSNHSPYWGPKGINWNAWEEGIDKAFGP